MAPPAAVAAERVVQDFPTPPPTGDPQADAMQAFAAATNRLAQAIEGFQPAADTVHGFGERMDALCTWVKGKWPWAVLAGFLVLKRGVEKPEDLIEMIKTLLSLFPGA